MSNNTIVETDVLPETLCERAQWVCWRTEERDGKQTKIPVVPGKGGFASSTNAETWTDFETARCYAESGEADGIGFVFSEDDDLVGVDLDGCRDPETGIIDESARDIIERLDSYTEISPSATGFHVLIRGELPEGRNRRGSVELYEHARFFTVTGHHVEETPTQIARRQDALTAIHREYVQNHDSDDESVLEESLAARAAVKQTSSVQLEDNELLENARTASNGAKFERLFDGNIVGYESQSEADMALCCMLAFWSGGNTVQMDRLFRQSGLLREKWDEVHYADGSTYGEKTVKRAVAATSEFYEPPQRKESPSDASSSHPLQNRGDTARAHAYVAEKNRLLTERIDKFENALNAKDEQIERLQAEVERLETLVSPEAGTEDHDVDVDLGRETNDETVASETSSLWDRSKRLLTRESE